MPGNDPERKLADARRRVRESDLPEADKEPILAYSNTVDERKPQGEDLSDRTNATYTDHLRRIARRRDAPLLEWDTKDVTDVFASMSNDYAPRTLGAYQSAAKSFYRHTNGHAVDAEEIDIDSAESHAVDPTILLSEGEFFALREAATNTRDRALVDLLGYTGQRVRAIQTLRVGDVEPQAGESGRYTLNADDGGLKGADRSMKRRPLLGARRSVIDLLNNHPTGEDDDYLITSLPSARNGTPGEMLSQTQIRRVLEKLADRAGIDTNDTPTNPHAFRHYAATVMYRDYEMAPSTIKKLLGHDEDSNVFEKTYRHLGDDDVSREAEQALGLDTEDNRSCPPVCPDCLSPLKDGTERCECGTHVADEDAGGTADPIDTSDPTNTDAIAEVFASEMDRFMGNIGSELGLDLGLSDAERAEYSENVAARLRSLQADQGDIKVADDAESDR